MSAGLDVSCVNEWYGPLMLALGMFIGCVVSGTVVLLCQRPGQFPADPTTFPSELLHDPPKD